MHHVVFTYNALRRRGNGPAVNKNTMMKLLVEFMRDKRCIYECVRFYYHFEEFGIYIARDKGGSEWGNGFYG